MTATPKKLFLVDAMAHVYRAFFAPMPQRLTGPGGIPTNIPFLFGNILKRLIKDYQPDYIGIVFDPPGATFRDKLFEKYKAQRQPMPDEMRVQLPFVRRLCEAMRLPVLEVKGYEADDVIGTMAVKAGANNLEVLIVSNDKDMMQLVGKNVRTLRTGSGGLKGDIIVDEKKVEELLGVPPEKVVDYMALLGDTIDNIPGAKGIGEKGAAELIKKYGSVESALDHADEVSNKRYREALQQQREQVLMSKQLAEIAKDAPIEIKLAELEMCPPNGIALTELYRELGFSSLLKELGAEAAAPVVPADSESAVKADYAQLASAAEFREYLAKLPAKEPLAVWLNLETGERETEGFGTRIASIEVSSKAGEGRAVWMDEQGEALKALAPLLADSKRQKIVHDPKLFQLLTSRATGIRHATQLYSYLLRPTTANHNFADVVMRQFNAMMGGGPGERADYLQRLAPTLHAQVQEQKLETVYEKIDLPLAPVIAEVERIGVRVDPKELEKMSRSMEKQVRHLEKEIWKLAGSEFNVNSPTQLAEILFDKLNLQPNARRGKAKARSTAADVLEELSAQHPLPAKIIEYREIAKLKSTYVDALPKLIHRETGRLHTSFSQTGTATGRLSSSDPNLQNIPIRTELGREIRAAFVAEKGKILLSADYSQIELRIMAHFSKDPVLVEAFRNGEDIHARTAQEVFGVGPMAQNAEHRHAAKAINFGIIYGLSPFGLAQQLGIEQKEAAKFINAYFTRYRGVKEYLENILADTRKTGVAKTLFGRIRPIPEINSPQMQLRNFAERTALNSPLQGTAADLIKMAMINIDRRLAKEKFEAKMILQVHDELLFEAPTKERAKLEKLVREEMEGVHKLAVPIVVEIGSGPNWRDLD
ncbi:MAG: DNA polymerase I [Acidobacteria bacterium 13_2_20CM_57_17]|nr:MAG: DNA polymerase I [Acidobacteria bacterium 13_2_20CM_57_17]OLB93136.1 MAG: DNA polymerase I [Acidobacteria bacterium 13_2_20CM_2_57_12]